MIETLKFLFELVNHIISSFIQAFQYLSSGLSYATGIITWFPAFISSALTAVLAIFVMRFILFR